MMVFWMRQIPFFQQLINKEGYQTFSPCLCLTLSPEILTSTQASRKSKKVGICFELLVADF